MKKISAIAVLVLTACLFAVSCGPITSTATSNTQVLITSEPAGAVVMFEGNTIGTTPCSVSMPVTDTAVNHGSIYKPSIVTTVKPWELQFIKDGAVENVSVDPSAVPVQNGLKVYNYVFTNAAYMYDPTIMAGEADNMVSRDNPGQTALERTIIRWYFDSDPRGARVFWWVFSIIPLFLNNTIDHYLATTPLEETRAFNILGLTYENSRDVQIEVKVSRNGYMDQVKRFNVRQAIDQQEISSFFELVKDEE